MGCRDAAASSMTLASSESAPLDAGARARDGPSAFPLRHLSPALSSRWLRAFPASPVGCSRAPLRSGRLRRRRAAPFRPLTQKGRAQLGSTGGGCPSPLHLAPPHPLTRAMRGEGGRGKRELCMDGPAGRPPVQSRPPLPRPHGRPPRLRPLDSNRLPAERVAAEASRRFRASTPKRLSAEASTGFVERAAKAEIVSGGILAKMCVEV